MVEFPRVLALAGLIAFLAGAMPSPADAGQSEKKDKVKRGRTIGIITAKGTNFIEVKADGEAKGRRYVPRWLGGMPAKGGGEGIKHSA